MSTDLRALCAELLDEVAARPLILDRELIDRARAALAQPEPEAEGPTDEELLKLMPEQFREDLATVSRMAAHGAGTGVTPGLFRVSLNTGALALARAVLARWGHQPAPPAAGEVAELVAWLLEEAIQAADADQPRAAGMLTWAAQVVGEHADLQEQRQAAPVPVAWCNSGEFLAASAKRQSFNGWLEQHSDCDMALCIAQLPANALPLPSVEVK